MRILVLAVACLLLSVTPVSAVYYGQAREEVVKELGKPVSELKRGAREVMIFKTGRIELESGKVAVVQGLPVTDGPVAAPMPTPMADTPKAAESAAGPIETKAATEAPAKAAPISAAKEKSVEQQMIEADAAARTKMEKQIEELENPPPPARDHDRGPPRWLTFIVELIIKAVMMLAALKLTTKYWDVEISWFGLAMAAIADTVARAVVGAIALWALGMGTTMYADEATAALILVVVLRKVSYNQSLAQAVTITLTSKTFTVVVGSFLSVVLLRALFGGGGGLMPF
ncbi:MAG: hypothetical protein KF715_15325 [Candidatus Didemnitutus sp.]|nr:hypothetical protein [Candidatus Didemnitutus sp.]